MFPTTSLCSFNPRGILQADRKCDPEVWRHMCVSCFRKMSASQSPAAELTHSISAESFEQSCPFVLKTTFRNSPQRHKDNKLLGGMLCALNRYLQGSGYASDVFLSWHCRHDALLPTRTVSARLGYTSRIYLNDHMLVHRVNIIFAHSLQISSNFSLEYKMSLKVFFNNGKHGDTLPKYLHAAGLDLNEPRHRKLISIR